MNLKDAAGLSRAEKFDQIYRSALTLEIKQRAAYVAAACAGDAGLQEDIISLLTADLNSETVLRAPASVEVTDTLDGDDNAPPPTIIDEDALRFVTLDNRYQITERIGGGGMGDVYKARDTKMLNRPVVVKVLKAAASESDWLISKFKQEIEAANKIDTPGVVSFYDVGEFPGGGPYLVMQYVEGHDLRKAIPCDRGLPLDEVAEIIRQLGRTLNIAHEKGIIHRDLKPENIMFRRDENGDLQVKVIDFGIAKIKDSMIAASTSTGLVVGTPLYMSPEQLNPEGAHKREIAATSDIYALGIIAYEMVTGRRPFNAETPLHLADLQRQGVQIMPCALRPALPEAAQRAILKALAYHPAERHQRIRDFCTELSQSLLAEPAPPSPEPAPPPPLPLTVKFDEVKTLPRPQPSNRTRLLVVGASAVVLVGLVLAGVWWKFFPQGTERNFTYSLRVQKMRDGQPFEPPFVSAGQEVYEKGYKMQALISSRDAGYFYLFDESTDENNQAAFYLQFPTPKRNNGVAQISAGQQFESGWSTFKLEPGTESLWFIWTAQPEAALEAARAAAFTSEQGKVTGPAAASLREFIKRADENRAEVAKDVANQRTLLKSRGDTMLHLLQLEYR